MLLKRPFMNLIKLLYLIFLGHKILLISLLRYQVGCKFLYPSWFVILSIHGWGMLGFGSKASFLFERMRPRLSHILWPLCHLHDFYHAWHFKAIFKLTFIFKHCMRSTKDRSYNSVDMLVNHSSKRGDRIC